MSETETIPRLIQGLRDEIARITKIYLNEQRKNLGLLPALTVTMWLDKLEAALPRADVSSRLQQLEQEKATLEEAFRIEQAIHKQEQENYSASWERERALRNTAEDALELQAAALAETRDALHRLVAAVERDDNPRDEGHSEHSDEMQKARDVLSRVERERLSVAAGTTAQSSTGDE